MLMGSLQDSERDLGLINFKHRRGATRSNIQQLCVLHSFTSPRRVTARHEEVSLRLKVVFFNSDVSLTSDLPQGTGIPVACLGGGWGQGRRAMHGKF
jgi:hypothetical protein